MTNPVTVLSLGAGVQSSALLLMSDRGEIARADFAVFADTQAEPVAVYEWLDFLERQVSIPIVRVTHGNIAEDAMGGKERFASPPFFVKNPPTRWVRPGRLVAFENEFGYEEFEWVEDPSKPLIEVKRDAEQGIARRQCTADYKLKPIFRAVRERLGYAKGERVKHSVNMLIGISLDETHRMNRSRVPWITNHYPLVEIRMRRQQAIEYVENILGATPPRSACYMCPYRSDAEWRHLQSTDPAAFAKAIEFDHAIRKQEKFAGESYLHRSMKPLDQVDLADPFASQLDLFGEECQGMCGV